MVSALAVSVLNCFNQYLLLGFQSIKSIPLAIFGAFIVAICTWLSFAPLVYIYCFGISHQLLDLSKLALKKCKKLAEDVSLGKRSCHKLMNACVEVAKMIETVDHVIGGLVFVDVVGSCVILTTGTFFGAMIFKAFENGFNIILFAFGIYFFSLGMTAMYKVKGWFASGQTLTNETRDLLNHLDEWLLVNVKDNDLTGKLAFVKSKWDKPAIIRPLNTFDLNNNSYLTLAGALLTYIVVMLQFKFSEQYPSCAQESMNQ